MKRLSLIGLVPAALIACGPTPPDFDSLSELSVEACGQVFSAAEVVRRAYDKDPAGELPAEVATPPGTVAVSELDRSSGEPLRRYPCANDDPHARLVMMEIGFVNISLLAEEEHVLIYDAVDVHGVQSAYSIFRCGFVGDVIGRRSGSIPSQGLFGTFGENGEQTRYEEVLRDLSSLTFATNMTVLADDGWPRYVEGITLLGSEAEVSPVFHPASDGERDSIGVCVTWVEPNLWGGCDAVRVGMSRTIAVDPEERAFHQLAIQSLLEGFYGYAGWCGRRQ